MSLITTDSARLVIGCAIAVHRTLGPGLFESVFEPCLAYEMTKADLHFDQQVALPISYNGIVFDRAFRADFIVEGELLVELKSVEHVLPVHHTQLLTYLKLSGIRKGLLINFNTTLLKEGLKSIVLQLSRILDLSGLPWLWAWHRLRPCPALPQRSLRASPYPPCLRVR